MFHGTQEKCWDKNFAAAVSLFRDQGSGKRAGKTPAAAAAMTAAVPSGPSKA